MEGGLLIDLDDRTIELPQGSLFTVKSRGQVHEVGSLKPANDSGDVGGQEAPKSVERSVFLELSVR